MDYFIPVPEAFFQVRTRVHNIIANFISPYDPGEIQIFVTDHNRTHDAKVRIKISRLPDDSFEDYISKTLPVRGEILKVGHKAAEYFKEKLK